MEIEPNTKIMQADLSRQTGLKARQIMRPFSGQTKGIQQFVIDRLNNLPNASQPAAKRFWPTDSLTALMRRSHHFHPVAFFPSLLWLFSSKTFVGNIRTLCRPSTAWQGRHWLSAQSKQGLSQQLVMARSRA